MEHSKLPPPTKQAQTLRILDAICYVVVATQLVMVLLKLEQFWSAPWYLVLAPTIILVTVTTAILLWNIWKFVHRVGSFIMTAIAVIPMLATAFVLLGKWDGHFDHISYTTAIAPTATLQTTLALVQLARFVRNNNNKSTTAAAATMLL